MEKKRTTDLFRFVTLRSAERTTAPERALGFVENTNLSNSHFLRFLGDEDFDTRIQQAIESFPKIKRPSEIESLSPNLARFASWLSQNKNSLDRASFSLNDPGIDLSGELLTILWDNVYYSILTRSNHAVRQACLQLLIANNMEQKAKGVYAENPDNAEQKAKETADLRRIANARVLIHQSLAAKKSAPKSEAPASPRRKAVKQTAQHEAKIASQYIPILEGIAKELICFEKQYIRDYNAALKNASAQYEVTVEGIIKDYLDQHPEIEVKGETEYQLPEDLVPGFRFEFTPPFAGDYTNGKLSEDVMNYLTKRCLKNESVNAVRTHVQNDLQELRIAASRSTKKKYETIMVNGVLTRPNSSQAKEFSISFKKLYTNEVDYYSILFLLDTGYNGATFTAQEFRLTYNGVTTTELLPRVHSAKDNSVFLELFTNNPIALQPNDQFVFEANLTLDNGKSLRIRKPAGFSTAVLAGSAAIDLEAQEHDAHFGINRLGIADYRRVEQELCCYIPGEVSHIENVMAREYKERSTRNLTSSETTTELTSEREAEELTDTTSSTRHEMSSEVAEVIERDRQSNLGFSTGVNGSYGAVNYSADAHGDFTFGLSTSDSNSMAQTYAEDVTRRALERIVQKTTLKRTSKMIREFEENNKHGYDNREGDQHVTGVFRWIDKVYKNRIYNYHKRLMYEFMIPEPARFYKDAIIIEAEEEDVAPGTGDGATGSTTTVVKPVNPSEYGMTDARSITRDNYAHLASLYGANVEVPMDEYANATHAFGESPGNTDASKSFSYNAPHVPDNYQCFQLVGNINFNYKAKVGAKAYFKVNLSGNNWERTEMRGESNYSESFSYPMSNVEGNIVSQVNTKKIVSFNVSVEAKCRLKASVYQDWQQRTYDDIKKAYEAQVRAFNEAQAMEDASQSAGDVGSGSESSVIARNPLFNAEIVKTELKRLCIEMLTKPFGIEQGHDFYQAGDCNVPDMILTSELDVYSARVKFFEQAFDWDLMSQKFYPYYWAKRCDWKTLFQAQDSNDYIFQSFLQSGMGRVIVPVRQGFEDAVVYFMETGEVWNGTGMTFDTDDQLYIDIIEELAKPDGYAEDIEWETIVPSSLTILQARSALLDEEGLPCCHIPVVLDEPTIKPDTNILELKTDTPTA